MRSVRFKSRARFEAKNLVLCQQLSVLIRKLPKRLRLTNSDRLRLVWLYRLSPSILSAIQIVRPETVIRWHRGGFRVYWRWQSRRRDGLRCWRERGRSNFGSRFRCADARASRVRLRGKRHGIESVHDGRFSLNRRTNSSTATWANSGVYRSRSTSRMRSLCRRFCFRCVTKTASVSGS